jgi:heme/copper-type cytochrome/quinol oxidase subunit 4
MSDPNEELTPRQTLLLILVPMLGTFLVMRFYLHVVRVQHIYPGGYLLHHLFTGALIVIAAAFVLAFGTRRRKTAILARVALGAGSGMVLDEVTFLVMTKAGDEDYVSGVSLYGGMIFMALGVGVLWALYRSRRGE